MSSLHLGIQTPLELRTEDLLLAGEVDDALLHPGELRRQELLELRAVRVDLGIGPATMSYIIERNCPVISPL